MSTTLDYRNINAWEFIGTMSDNSVDAIITDSPYQATIYMEQLRRICSGHIIVFCEAGKPFFRRAS